MRCYGKKRHSVFKTTEEMLKEIVTYEKVASTTKTQSVINAEIDQITKPFSYLTYFTLNINNCCNRHIEGAKIPLSTTMISLVTKAVEPVFPCQERPVIEGFVVATEK